MKYYPFYSQIRMSWCLYKSTADLLIAEFVELCDSEQHAGELADMMN